MYDVTVPCYISNNRRIYKMKIKEKEMVVKISLVIEIHAIK